MYGHAVRLAPLHLLVMALVLAGCLDHSLPCDSVAVACNCTSTWLSPGQIVARSDCASGQGQASTCPGACFGGGQPWKITCSCGGSAPDAGMPCAPPIETIPGCACDETPGSVARNLNLRFHAQHTDVWCWGAVSSSVTDYFRSVMGEDCQFLSAWWQYNGTPVNCCLNEQACHRPGLSMAEIQSALRAVGGVRSRWSHSPISESVLRQEIANGRPVIIGLTGFSGHVAVVSAATSAGFNVQDPYFGEFSNVPYRNLLSNAIGNWTDTLYEMGTEARCSN